MLNQQDLDIKKQIIAINQVILQEICISNIVDMRTITADINGIIREMGLGEADILIPLFETVVNSIQAIEELQESNGIISIYIERDKKQQALFEEFNNYPISSIKVTDNGIGFTNENIESYYKVYSPKKISLGGKGIGRFASLSFFKDIDVESIVSSDSNNLKIKIHLDRDTGLVDEEPVITKNHRETSVVLSNLEPRFTKISSQYNQESIADNLLEHCLLYFLNDNAPTIHLFEDGICINLKNQFAPKDFIHAKVENKLKEEVFTFYFVRSKKSHHSYTFCANNRKVKSKKVKTIFPLFSSPIAVDENNCFFDIYVVSDYLDSMVNSSRTDFNFPKQLTDDEDGKIDLKYSSELITEKEIESLIISVIQETFITDIENRRMRVKEDVNKYIYSDSGIGYRHLRLDDAFYNSIPDNASEKKLDDLLHEEEYKKSKENRTKKDKLLERDYSNKPEYQELLSDYVSSSTDEGISKLAEYVAHRKTIIELLDKYLEWSDKEDNYEQEQMLHNLIYTMGGNQDTIAFDKHNLWLLDDRLTFHRYIYSDKQIKSHEPVEGIATSQKETDLAIYDVPFLYGEKDNYQEVKSVVIFELKRPNRNVTYSEFSNQMMDQISGILGGTAKDYKKRNVSLLKNTPITFYYVCDVNTFNTLKDKAELDGFKLTPYNSLLRLVNNCHEEIITYQGLLVNARRRNAIFFQKLGL